MRRWLMLSHDALRSLRGNLLRSLLAMGGVVIGVAAVIAMLAIAAGAERRILTGLSDQGADVLYVVPEWRPNRPPRWPSLADARAVANSADVLAVAPVKTRMQVARVGRIESEVRMLATTEAFFTMNAIASDLAQGRLFTAAEVAFGQPLVVLGGGAAAKLFPDRTPVGGTVRLGGLPVEVIGVLRPKGKSGFHDNDNLAIVPQALAHRGLVDSKDLDYLQVLAEPGRLESAEDAVGRTMLRQHRLIAPADRDFAVHQNREIIAKIREITAVFAALLGGAAATSLLVGGIGIMNIMLVAVTERTREIGLRKAIGARERDIRRQFLLEAIAVTGLGGVLGVMLGWGLARAAALAMPFPPVIEPGAVLLALGCATAVGLFFGWWPARRAARLDPIEALRHE